jgi:hypothetical protein
MPVLKPAQPVQQEGRDPRTEHQLLIIAKPGNFLQQSAHSKSQGCLDQIVWRYLPPASACLWSRSGQPGSDMGVVEDQLCPLPESGFTPRRDLDVGRIDAEGDRQPLLRLRTMWLATCR